MITSWSDTQDEKRCGQLMWPISWTKSLENYTQWKKSPKDTSELFCLYNIVGMRKILETESILTVARYEGSSARGWKQMQ